MEPAHASLIRWAHQGPSFAFDRPGLPVVRGSMALVSADRMHLSSSLLAGILDPRCKLCVFMGKTDPQAPRHQQQSMVLVPMDTPGIHVIRPLSVYGLEDAPG